MNTNFSNNNVTIWDPKGMRLNLAWQWKNDARAMLSEIGDVTMAINNYWSGDQNMAMSYLQQAFNQIRSGQSHNPPVYNAYLQCYTNNWELFWSLVASASYQQGDYYNCCINIDWQWEHNKESIKNAQLNYTDMNPISELRGMYFLMEGQRHNEGVMEGYRAAYRDIKDRFWSYINGKI